MLKIYRNIEYPSGLPNYGAKMLFDPLDVLVRENLDFPLTEDEMEAFTFCYTLSEYYDIIFDEKDIPRLKYNLQQYLMSVVFYYRAFPIRLPDDNYFLGQIVFQYFKKCKRNPDTMGPLVKETRSKMSPF